MKILLVLLSLVCLSIAQPDQKTFEFYNPNDSNYLIYHQTRIVNDEFVFESKNLGVVDTAIALHDYQMAYEIPDKSIIFQVYTKLLPENLNFSFWIYRSVVKKTIRYSSSEKQFTTNVIEVYQDKFVSWIYYSLLFFGLSLLIQIYCILQKPKYLIGYGVIILFLCSATIIYADFDQTLNNLDFYLFLNIVIILINGILFTKTINNHCRANAGGAK